VVDQAPSEDARRAAAAFDSLGVQYLTQPRLGLSASRNLALETASTSLLAVTDDDCAPDPGWVRSIEAVFSGNMAVAAVTGPIMPLGPQPPGTYAVSLRESMSAIDHTWPSLPWAVGSGANFAAPCAFLRAKGGWDERLGAGSPGRSAEDADLIYRILRGGDTVRYEPAAVVRHEWQTHARRRATRWSYGYGLGALCGLWLGRGDLFALRMLAAYARLQVGHLAGAARRRDRGDVAQFWLALASLPPGFSYGLRAARNNSHRAVPDPDAPRP
jgi:glycosyltransferase involved in cell wall biosynthesis